MKAINIKKGNSKDARELYPELNDPEKRVAIAFHGTRLRLGLTQKQMAEKIGLSQSDVSKIEKGELEISRKLAIRIGEKLKVDCRRFLLVFVFLFVSIPCLADTCQDWFNQLHIEKNYNCLIKCQSAPVGMDSFRCHDRCDKFCQKGRAKTLPEKILGELLLYPGLTAQEQKLIRRYPIEAVEVFIQKERAEIATSRVLGRDEADDESDAFRHFIWVGLMTKEIGAILAKKFSDAHESDNPKSPSSKMDLSNNASAISVADELVKQNHFSQEALEQRALKDLKDGKLVVLKPKGMPK